MKINSRIILKGFLGRMKPTRSFNKNENYWLLIGSSGTIIEIQEKKFLILFDENLDNLGLENHNPIKNTLWILKSDVEIINN